MAIGGYGYSPDAAKSSAPAEIKADLDTQGLSLDDDTVRKWLRVAATTVLEGKPLKR